MIRDGTALMNLLSRRIRKCPQPVLLLKIAYFSSLLFGFTEALSLTLFYKQAFFSIIKGQVNVNLPRTRMKVRVF